jgi:hypothetical protein
MQVWKCLTCSLHFDGKKRAQSGSSAGQANGAQNKQGGKPIGSPGTGKGTGKGPSKPTEEPKTSTGGRQEGSQQATSSTDLKAALECLKGKGCLSAEELAEVEKRLLARQEEEAKQAGTAVASAEASPPEEKTLPSTKLAAAAENYRLVQKLASKLDNRKDSVARAKAKLAQREQELEQAKKNLEQARTFLEERELAEEEVRREYLAAELAVKASPSLMLEENPEEQAQLESSLVAFYAYGNTLSQGKQGEPPAFPETFQHVFRKYVKVFGYEKCMGIPPPEGSKQASGSPADADAKETPPDSIAPKGAEKGEETSPGTPPLLPESKKQKTGGVGGAGEKVVEEDMLPAAFPLSVGGAGLGRSLFGALSAATVAAHSGAPTAPPRSRSRSRASSASAPIPTELGQRDTEVAELDEVLEAK